MTITQLELDALKPKDKSYVIREKQLNKKDGTLGFKVLTTGDIDAYFIYYVDGKEKLKKIGRYGKAKMSLKMIRDRYRELSKEYQAGIDVKVQEQEKAAAQELERQAKEEAERKKQLQGSFQQLADFYLEHVRTNLSNHSYVAIKKAFVNLSVSNTSVKANEVTKTDIINILHSITERGSLIMANRMRSYLSAMFNWGIEFDDTSAAVKHNVQFFIESNPVANVKKPLKKENASERVLTELEVYTFWGALNDSGMSEYSKNVLRLMLCLGSRVEALAGLRWDEIDWKERLITIPPERSKKGNYWVIPINDLAYTILSGNPKLHDIFMFPANNGTESLSSDSIGKAVTRLCKQIGMEHFSPKDLRSTFKTLSGKAKIGNKEIKDRIQNHAFSDVSSLFYDRYDYLDEKRHALGIWNNYLTRIVNNESMPENVIPMHGSLDAVA